MSIKDKIKECIKEGKRREKHKGLRKIKINNQKAKNHLNKAIHNLKAMISFQKTGFSDWSASAAFYVLYHCLLALIAKEGYESRNQSCTFALIEGMINKGKISLTKKELKEIYDKDINLEYSDKILDIRENMQYSTKTSLEREEFIELKNRVKKLFDKLRKDIEK